MRNGTDFVALFGLGLVPVGPTNHEPEPRPICDKHAFPPGERAQVEPLRPGVISLERWLDLNG
jgi:hypothetical protein